ncbi:hypothetical protein HQ531_10135 [bacterium]|nr:hypothetical protein [bacterium]
MSAIDKHPILGQLSEQDRRTNDVKKLQKALAERRRVMDRDGKYTTAIAGFVGISGLFFMKPLSFYLILGMLVVGLPLIWRHLVKEAQDFNMSDDEIHKVLEAVKSKQIESI